MILRERGDAFGGCLKCRSSTDAWDQRRDKRLTLLGKDRENKRREGLQQTYTPQYSLITTTRRWSLWHYHGDIKNCIDFKVHLTAPVLVMLYWLAGPGSAVVPAGFASGSPNPAKPLWERGEQSGTSRPGLPKERASSSGTGRLSGSGLPRGRVVQRGSFQLWERAAIRAEAAVRFSGGAGGNTCSAGDL